jgi:hypothetical protein
MTLVLLGPFVEVNGAAILPAPSRVSAEPPGKRLALLQAPQSSPERRFDALGLRAAIIVRIE